MTRGVIAALILLAGGTAASAQPASPDTFRHERAVTVSAPGPQRLDLDVTMLAGTQAVSSVEQAEPRRRVVPQGPPDLRLYTEAGVEVPYLFMAPPPGISRTIHGTLLPVAATKTTSGFEVDLREVVPSLDGLALDGLRPPFLKRYRLEGSGDRVRWTLLVREGTAFDLPNEGLRVTALSFTPGPYRYLRVTWDDANSARVGMPAAARGLSQGTVHPSQPLRVPVEFEPRNAEPGHSRFHLRLPGSHLPIDALELSIGGGHLLRDVRVLEARLSSDRGRSRLEPTVIGQGRLTRVIQNDVSADAMTLRIAPPGEPDLDLVFDDGDNPPLDLRGVTAVFAELPWIYFEAQPGTLIARFGNVKAEAPRYDLEAVRASLPAAMSTATWGPERSPASLERPAPGLPLPTRGSQVSLSSFTYRRTLPPGPAGLTVVSLDAAAFAHSASEQGRFADVRVLDTDGLQVPYLLEKRDEPLTLDLRLERRDPPAAAETGHSEYVVAVPYREISGATLVLTTRARVFRRMVRIGLRPPPDRQGRTVLRTIETRVWEQRDEAAAAPRLTLPLPPALSGEVVLDVDEGDNQPLPIERATLLVPSYAVRFFRSDAAPLLLAYGGQDLTPPRYDLSLLAPYVLGQRARPIEAGPERGRDGGPDGPPSRTLVSPGVFWGALSLAVIVLLGLVVRLVRREA